ncbi:MULTISPECIES: polyhydroxyalkanoic acid system family protein [unclassified Pseudomonas]|uniref:polyhydroxyalkanoic acid system family protein n=1 Tax=unclassified Pseudomonas TaxID=196821 RepID=UPI000BD45872|nr:MULTISPECIES: polyhydroxyalkanoic acid system family protein [unclassified Pseudomonas]PVZ09666.1 putative polyhydroxyalkanoate system protein [Pseudomonas sp. URIL14HWK12:I12]PVZ21578.1 putative polyhydroxyalkanoate system protein [Pseudomonas sp. URIL14HWK12:I10]PVZ30241.1 putative polyhydroxyalkanoate system protein [Pseudomonas sp. URIL14HWK12:I11]SNZ18820.1 putative polyhydroxyalkanoic acid system protein [Pseudomonas sp. URIL14HWK12:I9]
MSQITVERQHTLGREAARARAGKLVEKLQSKYDMQAEWEGDTVELKRSGITGQVAITDTLVRVEIKLGMMLSMMSAMVEAEINKALDKHLA